MSVLPKSVEWIDGSLFLLDQTKLPLEVVIEEQLTVEQVWDSIKKLKVRGAPAIGIAGAYGLLVALKEKRGSSKTDFFNYMNEKADYLDSARPTAVNLSWALKRMLKKSAMLSDISVDSIYCELEKEAIEIHEEDKRLCKKIGEEGLHLIKEGSGILTHCNAGALAVSELGTALSPIYLAHANGVKFRVYADETRPLLQGARLTTWELHKSGVDTTLITDNMAGHIMSQGLIDLVIVGADRVAANGDVANKIGTLSVAILAKHFNIPFYSACPYSTIDMETETGRDIVIEERDGSEVFKFQGTITAPETIKTRNPAFDVTPSSLITGIITERGILSHPFEESLKQFS